jgi:alpha-L-fucosidase
MSTSSSLSAPATAAPSVGLKLAPRFNDARDWWFERRFGLFIHWGLYSINGWHEQEQWRRHVSRADYARLADEWNPARFDPEAWLDLAESTGMRYVCLTTKHHDGFCLWDTKLTPYNTMNAPYGRDIVKQLAEACHRRGMPLCLYYSVVDWHQFNYPNQGRHHEIPPQDADTPDLARYIDFVKGQVRELCTHYGEIHGFWWDMNVDQHVDPSVNALIRSLQPSAVINDRGYDSGDFGTPERDYDNVCGTMPFSKRTEGCQSIGREAWGWRKNEDYYTDRHLLKSIDTFLARDANYLLNIGPLADGSIPTEAVAILGRIGRWYAAVNESFENVLPAPHLCANPDILLTRRGNTLYVHLNTPPGYSSVKLKPLATLPFRATLLNTGTPVSCVVDMPPSEHEGQHLCLRLTNLPVNELSNTVMIVKLEFEHLPEDVPHPVTATSELMER